MDTLLHPRLFRLYAIFSGPFWDVRTLHFLKYRASQRYSEVINVRRDVQPSHKVHIFENNAITEIMDPENSTSESPELEVNFPD